jgi:hypothetical protein
MKRLILALALALCPSLGWAQNKTCPTRPAGDSTNACASTAFVTTSVAANFASPPPLGNSTPNTVAATTLSATGAVSGTGFTALFASPPPIGITTPSSGAFTTLSTTGLGTLASETVSGLFTIGGFVRATNETSTTIFIGPTDYLGVSEFSGGKYGYGASATTLLEGNTQIPFTTAVRTRNLVADGFGAIIWCFNDLAGSKHCWAQYDEARRYVGAGPTENGEWDTTEFGTSTDFDPYSLRFGNLAYSAGLRLGSGGGCTAATPCFDAILGTYTAIAQPASVAINILNVGSTYRTGISFDTAAINGVDGKTLGQFGPAMKMAVGQTLDWQSCTNITSFPVNCAVNNVTARITAQQGTAAVLSKLIFVDNGIQIQNAAGASQLSVNTSTGLVAAAGLVDASAGGLKAPAIANGTVATVLGSLGPVGSHTTVQEWLQVQGTGGVIRYVPGF